MAVSNTTVKALYTANGALTTFAIPFAFISGDSLAEVKVYFVDPTTGVKTIQSSGYTLTPIPDPGPPITDPSNVVFDVAPLASVKVLVERTLTLEQPVSFLTTGNFDRKSVEKGLDRLLFLIQQLDDRLDHTLQFNILDDSTLSGLMPPVEADSVIVSNGDGSGFTFVPSSDFVGETGPQGPAGTNGTDGDGFINTGPFTALENATTSLTGELYDSDDYDQVDFVARIKRGTEVFTRFEFSIFFRDGAWELATGFSRYHELTADYGTSFTVHPTTGQISAVVDNSGEGNAIISFKKTLWAM